MALRPCACAVALRRPKVRTRLCVLRRRFPSRERGVCDILGSGEHSSETAPLAQGRGAGASVSGSPSRGACWDADPGEGWALAVGTVRGSSLRSRRRPPGRLSLLWSTLEDTQRCFTCAAAPAAPVQEGPVVFGLLGPSCLDSVSLVANGLYY